MSQKKSPTVKEHLAESNEIRRHIEQADALTLKLQSRLSEVRAILEWARQFDHPLMKADCRYKRLPGTEDGDHYSNLGPVVDATVKKINALLGDRA